VLGQEAQEVPAMAVRPIHHRGDREAAGEWGGCDGDRGHWGLSE
jgi:hypothetical protein